ncbi:uncharacterized protein N7473_008728 [Penicillium subrubescens]|uniref:uncharacterized protein n=1 Tax=Penicillium subrubescens TaxID=1316194 RepID=UPI0025450E28|nr:uncharacterized protein N7473_008728 [Penicillium subrubescens]KAJ5886054.1 hypothetical protein N7473_008728 [Penicillium subrubescens]
MPDNKKTGVITDRSYSPCVVQGACGQCPWLVGTWELSSATAAAQTTLGRHGLVGVFAGEKGKEANSRGIGLAVQAR